MAKQSNSGKPSPFDALRIARAAETVPAAAVPAAVAPAVQTAKPPDSQLAKSVDPEYMKFTTYVRRSTHLAVKSRLVTQQRELSDLVEELLNSWLSKQANS
ncbi:hypothetical protein F183_A54720 (plasmid) [Bryobacterales bacterium F-183]|nr:hypothetical protein F183_A54720 [Bryobacterales bacterium F-183]